MPLRVLSLLINFLVILLIAFRTLSTACFNSLDINLSLVALIFSVIVELIAIRKYK